MLIHATEPLFAWGQLEDCPTLTTLRDFLQAVPDQQLLDGLRAARGHGRDDYPVARLWGVVLLTIALRHVWFNACLAELHRNPPLCRLIGITAEGVVASIGHTFNASLWARMARVHIVAEITPKDTPDYWQADATTKAQVREILAREGVKAIVTDFPMKGRPSDDSDAHWQQIGNSSDKDQHMYYGSLLAR
jgi:hypothetical protein